MKAGLIGYGYWGGGFVARNIARVFDLEVIVDPDPERLALASSQWGAWGTRVASEPEVAFSECDLVWIATPVATHGELVRRALLEGVHVVCEKPFVLSREEAEGLCLLAADRDLALLVGHLSLFTAQFRAASEAVHDCLPGKVKIHARRLTDRASGSDHSVLFGLGPHDIAAIIQLLGVPSDRVWRGNRHRAIGSFFYDRGDIATFELDWLAQKRWRSFQVGGVETARAADVKEPLLAEAQAALALCLDLEGEDRAAARALAFDVTGELVSAHEKLAWETVGVA